MLGDVVVVLIAYLLGSIPFAYVITRVFSGKDIRIEGDGNVGTRNVLHVVGLVPGLLTSVLDTGKGAAAYWVGRRWGSADWVVYLAGFALMLGHGFPVWLGWRGGKGLASATGFLLQMWPYSVLGAAIVFVVAHAVIAKFSPAYAVAAAALPLFTYWEGNDLKGLLFIALLLGMAGAKRLIDLPRERAVLSRGAVTEDQAGPAAAQSQHTR